MIGETTFELIAQEILKQQRLMKELEAENQELRRQLTEIRAGRGIMIEVCGQLFAVRGQTLELTDEVSFASEDVPEVTEVVATPMPSAITDPALQVAIPVDSASSDEDTDTLLFETPTLEMPKITVPEAAATQQQNEQPSALPTPPTTPVPPATPTFLEEMMIDEFSLAASGSPAIWTGPIKKDDILDEAKKAELRRELMGSFLLE